MLVVPVNGNDQFDMGTVATQEERLAVVGFAQLHDQVVRPTGGGWAEGLDFLLRRYAAGQGIDDLAFTVQPQDLRNFRRVLQHVFGAQAEGLAPVGQAGHVERQLLDLLLVAVQVELQALLQPQYILDQRGPVFLNFVAMQQPEQ